MTSAEPLDATKASPQMENGNQPTVDELEEINIGTDDDPRPIFISNIYLKKVRKNTINFFLQIEMSLLGLMKKFQV